MIRSVQRMRKKAGAAAVNTEQYRYLMQRIETARYHAQSAARRNVKDPEHIARARKLVNAYDKALKAARDRAHQRIAVQVDTVKRTILFGSPEQGLTAVQKFEKDTAV